MQAQQDIEVPTPSVNDMVIGREEIFGPVIAVFPFEDPELALKLADDAPDGLGGAVWTQNVSSALKMAHEIKTGTIWVNCYSQIDPSIGFGVIKMNGYGSKVARSMWKSPCTKGCQRQPRLNWAGRGTADRLCGNPG